MPANNGMGEKEILSDLFNTEKQIIGAYSTAISESSCGNMRQVMMSNAKETIDDQFALYNVMLKKGYCQAKDAPEQDVQQAKQKYQQMQSQL
jgi:spore coat protein CotF